MNFFVAEQLRKIVINAEVNESVTDEILHQLREENAELLMTLRNDENLELKYSDPKGNVYVLVIYSIIIVHRV